MGVKVGDTLPLHSQIDYDGDTVPLGWKQIKDDDKVIVSSTEPTGEARKKVWLQHSNNLAWFNNVTTNSTGTEYRIDNIKPNTAYTITYIKSRISGVTISVSQVYLYNSIKFYNNSGTLLDTISSTSSDIVTLSTTPVELEKTFTTPANTSYIVFDLGNHNGDFNNNTLISNIMLNAGSTALEYEEYVDDKEYILSDNDIYEELKKDDIIFRTIQIGAGVNIAANGVVYYSMSAYAINGYDIISITPHTNGSGAVNYCVSWVSGMQLNGSYVTFKNLASTSIVGTLLVTIAYKKK